MAQVVNANIWYPGGYPGTAYDLRKIVSWVQNTPTTVKVRFLGDPVALVIFDAAAFEAAKQASLDAGG